MGNTYPNRKGNYYYRNHTLYHIGTLDPLGLECQKLQRRYGLSNPGNLGQLGFGCIGVTVALFCVKLGCMKP